MDAWTKKQTLQCVFHRVAEFKDIEGVVLSIAGWNVAACFVLGQAKQSKTTCKNGDVSWTACQASRTQSRAKCTHWKLATASKVWKPIVGTATILYNQTGFIGAKGHEHKQRMSADSK